MQKSHSRVSFLEKTHTKRKTTILGGSGQSGGPIPFSEEPKPKNGLPRGSIVRNSHLSIGHDFAYASHLNGSLKQGVLMGRGGDLQVAVSLLASL